MPSTTDLSPTIKMAILDFRGRATDLETVALDLEAAGIATNAICGQVVALRKIASDFEASELALLNVSGSAGHEPSNSAEQE